MVGTTAAQIAAELRGADFGIKNEGILERGHDLEPVALKKLAKKRPDLEVWAANEFVYDTDLRFGVHPDAYARDKDGKRVAIEIKSVGKRRFERVWVDAPPPDNTLQLASTMMLDGSDYGLLCALVFSEYSALDLHIFDVPRHPAAEQRIRDTITAFWRDFDAGILPKVDYERDGALIALMYPNETPGKIVDLRHDNRMPELLADYERLSAELKDVDKARDAVGNEIKMKIGDAESALVNGWRVTLKLQTRKAHQVKESSFRVLRPKREEAA